MKFYRILHFAGLACVLSVDTVRAADPQWWANQGVKSGSQASNLSPATIGQAKHMVKMALAELEPKLPQTTYNAIQSDLAAIVNLTPPQNQAGFDSQRIVLLNGQLKALAKPFYVRLRAVDSAWLDNEMATANIRVQVPGSSSISYSPFPWSETTSDDSNKSPATIGQLKAVFSLRFENWGVAPLDADQDGVPDAVESSQGTSSVLLDTDGDGYNDSVDAFPLDPTRNAIPTAVPGDVTAPVVALSSPANSVQFQGP